MTDKNDFTIDLEKIRCGSIYKRTRNFLVGTSQAGIRINNATAASTGNPNKKFSDDAADLMNMMYMALKDDVFDPRLISNPEGTSKRILISLDRNDSFTILSPDTHKDVDYYDMLRRFCNGEKKYTLILLDVYKD